MSTTSQTIKINSAQGNSFDCYLASPNKENALGPAVVIMSSIFGVDDDVKRDANNLATQGYFCAAPDLFWRGDSGPLPRTEEGMQRARARAADRDTLIDAGLEDLAAVIDILQEQPGHDGQIVIVGLCYGGPYAILGPARLGCVAGLSFHGTKVEQYLHELNKVQVPLSLHWGDEDHAAPPETLARIRSATSTMKNVELIVYPGGIKHGYTAPSSQAWDEEATKRSWQSAAAILSDLVTRQ